MITMGGLGVAETNTETTLKEWEGWCGCGTELETIQLKV